MTRLDGWFRHLTRWTLLGLGMCLLVPAAVGGEEDADVVERVRKSRRALVKSLIEAPEEEPLRADLEATIQRLRAIRVKPKQKAVAGPTTRSGEGAAEDSDAADSQAAPSVPPKPPKPARTVSEEQLERLRKLPPERIADPVALADALLKAGYHNEAYLFYERALKSGPPEETEPWLLFRTARSRAAGDPEAAAALYRRLISEHPDSPWSDVAGTLMNLLEWYETSRPAKAAQIEDLTSGISPTRQGQTP